MSTHAAVILVGLVVATSYLVGTGNAGTSETYYWSSFEASLAIEKSDWGDARGVDSATCRGVGKFKKEYGTFSFARFRCELEDRNYDRIGFVTIFTTGPEAWKPANFIRPRCR